MSKINLKSVTQILNNKEMKNVLGGLDSAITTLKQAPGSEFGNSGTSKPCPNNGCDGPHGTPVVGGGLCCLLPCNGIFKQYGYGVVKGMSKCP